MALIVTVAGATSDSYITVAQADALAEQRLGREAEAWLNASITDKEKALRQAAVDIDGLVRSTSRFDAAQALLFPRLTDIDGDFAPLIPAKVKQAQYEQASYLISNANVMSDAATRRARQMFQFAEDNISGTIALDPEVGLIAPRAASLMGSLVSVSRSTLKSVPITTRTWPLDT